MLTYIPHPSQLGVVPIWIPDCECADQTPFLLVSLPSHLPAANQIKNAYANWNPRFYQAYKNIKGDKC